MKKIISTTVFMLLCSVVLFASDVEGKWQATVETEMGAFSFIMDYKVDGEKISGALISEMGDMTFSDGTISGNEFEYTLDMQGMKITHKGVLDGDKINMKSSGDYGDSEFVMTRVKE